MSTVMPSRSTDPDTAHESAAAVSVGAATARREMLHGFYLIGSGNDEQAAEAAGVPLSTEYCKRASELRAGGFIEVVPDVKIKGSSGLNRQVSRITDDGVRAFENDEELDVPSNDRRAREKRVMKVVESWMVPLDVTTTGKSTQSKGERWSTQFARQVRLAWGEIE